MKATMKNRVIRVPNIPGPKVQLCYARPPLTGTINPMEICDRPKGHGGLHTWLLVERIRELEQAVKKHS